VTALGNAIFRKLMTLGLYVQKVPGWRGTDMHGKNVVHGQRQGLWEPDRLVTGTDSLCHPSSAIGFNAGNEG